MCGGRRWLPVLGQISMNRLRAYFLTGFVVSAPLAITAYIAWSLIGWVDGWVKPYLPSSWNPDTYLPFAIPGFGLIVAILLITLTGFFAANFVGRYLVGLGEGLLARTPLIRSVYGGLKQIFETAFSNRSEMFHKVAVVEYPRAGNWSLVFISNDKDTEISRKVNRQKGGTEPLTAVFLPCTPNPTTGYLIYVPKSDLIELDMSVEEAFKLLISVGLVVPGEVPSPQPYPALKKRMASSLPKT